VSGSGDKTLRKKRGGRRKKRGTTEIAEDWTVGGLRNRAEEVVKINGEGGGYLRGVHRMVVGNTESNGPVLGGWQTKEKKKRRVES